MGYPDFYIVGAARSGTTSMWQYLRQHPTIFMPADIAYKEPAYFADLYGLGDLSQYLALFSDASPDQACGEASTAYLSAPECPRRIYKKRPDAKIIIMLRNPVERAYSLYCWMVKEGYEFLSPFEKALKEEEKRRRNPDFKFNNPENFYNYLYFHSGLYSDQILRYLELFTTKQIHVILFDEFINDSLRVTKDVYRFLGVEPNFIPQLGIYNVSGGVYSIRIQYRIRQFIENNINFVPQRIRNHVMSFLMGLNMKSLQPPGIIPETRKKLQEMYQNDISQTAEIIGKDLSHWILPSST